MLFLCALSPDGNHESESGNGELGASDMTPAVHLNDIVIKLGVKTF